MQITCPSCAADYAVPDEKLAGRAVKCVRCGTQWTPMPEPALPELHPHDAPVVEEPPPAAAELPGHQDAQDQAADSQDAANAYLPGQYPPLFGTQWPPPDRAAPAPLFSDQPPAYRAAAPQPRSKGLIIAWILTIVILGAAVIACVVNRDAIMQAWPPSQRAYALFGVHPR